MVTTAGVMVHYLADPSEMIADAHNDLLGPKKIVLLIECLVSIMSAETLDFIAIITWQCSCKLDTSACLLLGTICNVSFHLCWSTRE